MISHRLRTAVRIKWLSRCAYCGVLVTDDFVEVLSLVADIRPYHCDHIHPKSKGGADKLSNLCCSCDVCNLDKSADLTGWHPEPAPMLGSLLAKAYLNPRKVAMAAKKLKELL